MSDPGERNALGQPVGRPVRLILPRPRPARQRLQGRYGAVVPLGPAHADGLFRAFAEDETGRGWTYLPVPPWSDAAAAEAWCRAAEGSDDPLYFAVCDPAGTPLGFCSYLRIAPDMASIEVGYIHFAPALQRSRLATETMALMMAEAFDGLGYRRYEWKCDALNAPSRRAAERLGFVYEGTFRKAAVVKGRNRDTAWYSVTDDDWPALAAAFRRWLDPANFDRSGRQRTSLASLRDRADQAHSA